MNYIDGIRAECVYLGARWLPGHEIRVEEFDFGCKIGVAVQAPDGFRTAVRGPSQWSVVYPRWWQFWRRPYHVRALTAKVAVAALAQWVIERDDTFLEGNEERL